MLTMQPLTEPARDAEALALYAGAGLTDAEARAWRNLTKGAE